MLVEVDGLVWWLCECIVIDVVFVYWLWLLICFFYGELGFVGNFNNYYVVDNSYIYCVLEICCGLLIVLVVLLLELGE